ncbi:MAG: pyridoxamine 5'-phosphate oxidase family protein [Candidatus Aenigmatarchaeota archaeon]
MVKISKQIKKLIEENALAFATVDKNGNPHCIAVGYAKVVEGNKIVITDVGMKETVRNILRKNKKKQNH